MSRNFDAIKAHYAGSDRGDLAAMMAPITTDTRWTEMAGFPYAGTYVGADAIIAGVFKRIAEEWTGYTFALERLIDGGTTIIGVGTYSGHYKSTGKAMTARVVHVWDVDEGRVVRFEQFTDTRLVADAMGDGGTACVGAGASVSRRARAPNAGIARLRPRLTASESKTGSIEPA